MKTTDGYVSPNDFIYYLNSHDLMLELKVPDKKYPLNRGALLDAIGDGPWPVDTPCSKETHKILRQEIHPQFLYVVTTYQFPERWVTIVTPAFKHPGIGEGVIIPEYVSLGGSH